MQMLIQLFELTQIPTHTPRVFPVRFHVVSTWNTRGVFVGINSDRLQWSFYHVFVIFQKRMKPYSDIFLLKISIQSNLDKKALSLNEKRDHSFSTYTKFSEKLKFLTP